MRPALGWVTIAAVAAACGRFDFDSRSSADGSVDAGCVGSQCGVQCETNCFPFEVYRAPEMPPDWATAAAAVSTGEVHLLYVDPRSGGLMWVYSDATLRHWSIPVDLAVDAVTRNFTSVALIRHADDSLTALVLDAKVTGSTLYRRLLTRTSAISWQPSEPLGAIALPTVSSSISLFSATADIAGTGGTIAFASDGGDTQTNAVYYTRSTDKFHSIYGLVNTSGWDQVQASVSPAFFLEVRVASDSQGAPWLLYHTRSSTNDDAVLARFVTGAWTTGLPGWGDPWHFAMSVAPDDTLSVTFGQEGTTGNPQHAEAASLTNVSGASSIGNWDWAAAPNAYLRSTHAREGASLRVIWEDPQTATLSSRDTDGSTWSATIVDVVGTVAASATDQACALIVAPEMIDGTSHIFWRDTIGTDYVLRYTPFTVCGGLTGTTCAFDQACISGVCTAR